MTGRIHHIANDAVTMLATARKKSMDLGFPMELWAFESMAPAPGSPGADDSGAMVPGSPIAHGDPQADVDSERLSSGAFQAGHRGSIIMTSAWIEHASVSPAVPQNGPPWIAPDQTVPGHHSHAVAAAAAAAAELASAAQTAYAGIVKSEPLHSVPESPRETPAYTRPSTRPSSDSDRKRRKLESNRRAARKFRTKKKDEMNCIYDTIAQLQTRNAALQREIDLINRIRRKKAGATAN